MFSRLRLVVGWTGDLKHYSGRDWRLPFITPKPKLFSSLDRSFHKCFSKYTTDLKCFFLWITVLPSSSSLKGQYSLVFEVTKHSRIYFYLWYGWFLDDFQYQIKFKFYFFLHKLHLSQKYFGYYMIQRRMFIKIKICYASVSLRKHPGILFRKTKRSIVR